MRLTPVLAAVLMLSLPAFAQSPAAFFKQACTSCHTIGGGRLTGPDLKNVAQRKDRAWLVRFISDPPAMLASGDAYAQKLLSEARNVAMPLVQGMSKARAEELLDLIAAESKLEKSQFFGVHLSDRPLTEDDVTLGRELFAGNTRLTNGGAPCISCHTTGSVRWLGGGRLGPDLTKVFERYENRKILGAWLSAPATATMAPTFREHPLDAEEILPLIAYFREEARLRTEEDASPRELVFILLGVAGAAAALVLFHNIWNQRFRSVRRALVERQRQA